MLRSKIEFFERLNLNNNSHNNNIERESDDHKHVNNLSAVAAAAATKSNGPEIREIGSQSSRENGEQEIVNKTDSGGLVALSKSGMAPGKEHVEHSAGTIQGLREMFENSAKMHHYVLDNQKRHKSRTFSSFDTLDKSQNIRIMPTELATQTIIKVTMHDDDIEQVQYEPEEHFYENFVEYRKKGLLVPGQTRISSTSTTDSGISSTRNSFSIYSQTSTVCLVDVLDDTIYDEIYYQSDNNLVRPTSAMSASKNRLDYLIEELIHTEEQYIDGLEKATKEYKPFVDMSTPRNLVKKLSYLFGSLVDICQKSKQFLALLYQSSGPEEIAGAFTESKSLFELYPPYAKNKPYSDAYIKDFDDIIRVKQKQMEDSLGLESYLLTPIQRMGKYIMLLTNMMEETEKHNLYSTSLNGALQMIKDVMKRSNDLVAIDSIKGCHIDLTQQGCFRMREKFTFVAPLAFDGTVFLFKHILVITMNSPETEEPEKFIYVDSIPMTELAIDGFDKKQRTFMLYSYDKVKEGCRHIFHLKAASLKIKLYWTEILQHVLWEQLKQAKTQSHTQKFVSESTMHYVQSTKPIWGILNGAGNKQQKVKFSPTNVETWKFGSLKRFIRDKLPNS